jgi:hypothetical protein
MADAALSSFCWVSVVMIGFNWLLPLLFLLALPLLPFVAEFTALLAFAMAAALICCPVPVMVEIGWGRRLF